MTERVAVAILVVLSVQFLIFGLIEAWRDAPTFDEGFHLAAGLTALTRHQLRLTPEHGVIPKVLGALPALLAHPAIPRGTSWNQGDGNAFYLEFLGGLIRDGKLHRVFFLARLVSLLEAVALGWALYFLTKGFFGRWAGVIAAAAWFTTPMAVAFGHIDGSDLPFALAVVLACIALRRWLEQPSTGRLVVVGVAGSGLLLTRFTGLALVPVLALVVAVGGSGIALKRRLVDAAVVLVVAWAGVWVVYRAISPFPRFRYTAGAAVMVRPSLGTSWARVIPWPQEFSAGILQSGRLATPVGYWFVFGRHGVGASWLYWPAAMIVKLPLGALLLAAAACAFWFVTARGTRARAAWVIVAPLVALALVTLPYKRPSLRYFLPGIVLLFVLGAPVLARLLRHRGGQVVLILLAVVQLLSLWDAAPHSLAWTAPPFRPGYRFIADTNDWGQDAYRLEHWSAGKAPLVAFFGLGLDFPGARPLFATSPRHVRGWVAVSSSYVTFDYLLPPSWTWLRAYCPVGTIGGSILLYNFRSPPNTDKGPSVAARPCPGRYSHRVDRASPPQMTQTG